MKPQDPLEYHVRETLNRLEVVITDSHLVYTSGKHGSAYVNKDAIYVHPVVMRDLCEHLAMKFVNDDIEVVVAPAVGAVILSQWVAFHLSKLMDREVFAVFADKEGESFVIKRGYGKYVKGKRTLVVDDILNTGGSARKVVQAVRDTGGAVIKVGSLVNRGGVTRDDLCVPDLTSLLDVKLEAFEAADCPLCKAQVPINTEVGKGREFLAAQKVV